MEHESTTVTFDLDAICRPAAIGITRAYVFLGLGLNAANDSRLTEYHLPGKAGMRFVPDAQSAEVVSEYKREFAVWILAGAMREAMESFAAFLDRLFEHCLVAESLINRRAESRKAALNEFERAGLDGKLRRLEQRFGLKTNIADEFQSLWQARNCLTHRRGVVGPEDCKDASQTGKLVVKFGAWDVFAAQPDGSEIILDEDAFSEGGVLLRDGGTISMRVTTHQVEFPIGSVIMFRPRELTDVFASIYMAVVNLRIAFSKFIEGLNARPEAEPESG